MCPSPSCNSMGSRSSLGAIWIPTAIPPSSSAPAAPRRRTWPSRSAAISARRRSSPRRSSTNSASPRTTSSTSAPNCPPNIMSRGSSSTSRARRRGKGFAGGMKRWNFGGLRATHGVLGVAPLAGVDRPAPGPGQGLQEQEDGRAHGRQAAHPAEPRDRRHRRRARADLRQRARCPDRRAAGCS